MTKRMIDADKLIEWIDTLKLDFEKVWGDVRDFDVCHKELKNKINEIATPAPAPQESIFDIDKWQNYLETNGHEGVLYKILFGNEKTLKLIPSCNGQEILNAFDDDNFNPLKNELHKNIFICLGLEVKDFLCELQESISDADGWCWDMSLLKADGTQVLLFDSHEGVSVGWRTDAGIYGHIDLINLTEKYPKREILDKIIQGYVIKWEAWKPFQFPTGGNK